MLSFEMFNLSLLEFFLDFYLSNHKAARKDSSTIGGLNPLYGPGTNKAFA